MGIIFFLAASTALADSGTFTLYQRQDFDIFCQEKSLSIPLIFSVGSHSKHDFFNLDFDMMSVFSYKIVFDSTFSISCRWWEGQKKFIAVQNWLGMCYDGNHEKKIVLTILWSRRNWLLLIRIRIRASSIQYIFRTTASYILHAIVTVGAQFRIVVRISMEIPAMQKSEFSKRLVINSIYPC